MAGGTLEDGIDFKCPKCERTVRVDEWRLLFAGARTGNIMRIMCGQPSWTPGWRKGDGCGHTWSVDLKTALRADRPTPHDDEPPAPAQPQ